MLPADVLVSGLSDSDVLVTLPLPAGSTIYDIVAWSSSANTAYRVAVSPSVSGRFDTLSCRVRRFSVFL